MVARNGPQGGVIFGGCYIGGRLLQAPGKNALGGPKKCAKICGKCVKNVQKNVLSGKMCFGLMLFWTSLTRKNIFWINFKVKVK